MRQVGRGERRQGGCEGRLEGMLREGGNGVEREREVGRGKDEEDW